MRRIGCVCPSEQASDFPEVFTEILTRWATQEFELEAYYPHRGDHLDVGRLDGVIVTGSEFHIYDRQSWVAEIQSELGSLLQHGVPVLGVCYGHQLLADYLGGDVEKMELPEAGFRKVSLTDAGRNHPLFAGLDGEFPVFMARHDCVRSLPSNIQLLAENERGIQAFESTTTPAYGIQFHPEIERERGQEIIDTMDISGSYAKESLDTFSDQNIQEARIAQSILGNFLDRIVV